MNKHFLFVVYYLYQFMLSSSEQIFFITKEESGSLRLWHSWQLTAFNCRICEGLSTLLTRGTSRSIFLFKSFNVEGWGTAIYYPSLVCLTFSNCWQQARETFMLCLQAKLLFQFGLFWFKVAISTLQCLNTCKMVFGVKCFYCYTVFIVRFSVFILGEQTLFL